MGSNGVGAARAHAAATPDTTDISPTYADVPTAQTYDSALAAIRAIGAGVVSLSTARIPAQPG